MDSTFNQRKALFNMYSALGWDLKGIREMTKEQASAAIQEAQKYIDEHGFPHSDEEPYSKD
jgi:hypothetical protein